MERWVVSLIAGWLTDGLVDGWVVRLVDNWSMDGWMNRRMDGFFD